MAIKKNSIIAIIISITLILSVTYFIFFRFNSNLKVTVNAINPIILTVDGSEIGEGTSFELKLEEGQHELSYTQPNLEKVKFASKKIIQVVSGKENIFYVAKNPTVRLISDPKGAIVFLILEDSRQIAVTPASIEFPPGSYNFKFVLNGKEQEKGPIELNLDDKKIIEVFFGKVPEVGIKPTDNFVFTSITDGVKVCTADLICGITPVSFPTFASYSLKYDTFSVIVPSCYNKQYTFCKPWAEGLDVVVSNKEIPWSYGSLVCKGGFYQAEVIGKLLRITPHQSNTIDIELPDFDTPLLLLSNNTWVTFIAKKNDLLTVISFDAFTGTKIETPSLFEALRGFITPIQSEDGTLTRYFFTHKNRLFELDLNNLKCFDLGEIPTDTHLRRLGSMIDFFVGIFNSNGRCVGARSQRKSVNFNSGFYMGTMQKIQAEIIAFFNGKEMLGFDTLNGSISWTQSMSKLIWSIAYDQNEDKWFVDLGDPETLTPVESANGEILPDTKRLDKQGTVDFEKGVYLGFIMGENGKTSMFRNPDNFIVAIDSNNRETWRMQVDDVICSTGFETFFDLGIVCVIVDGQVKPIDLSTGQLSEPIIGDFLSFPNNYSIHTNQAFYTNGKHVVIGNVSIISSSTGYLVRFNDGSSAYIME